MKTFKCDNCGAGLNVAAGAANVKCDYCGAIVRVVDDSGEQYNPINIINQIVEIWPRVRKDNFDKQYQRVKEFIEKHQYLEAHRMLNDILDEDNTQARAWFYKSLLPVLEQESIVYCGCYINIGILSQITDRRKISKYLSSCGLPWHKQKNFMRFYASKDFLYEQHLKFLDKAIQNASTKERKEFFIKHKNERVARQKSQLRRRKAATFFLILLLSAVIVGGIIFISGVVINQING